MAVAAAMILGVAVVGGGACIQQTTAEEVGVAQSSLHDFWQNNAECGFAGCSGGQVRTCGNVCATPVTVGNTCSQDDCTSNSVCEEGASCVFLSSQFQCAFPPFGMTLFSDCSADKDGCAHDLWCRDFDTCTSAPQYGDRCAAGVAQGYSCDSEWDDPACAPCMPGMDCMGAAGNKKCRLPCENDANCPCGDTGAVNACNPADDHCYRCRSTGQSCNENTLCCDTGTFCGPTSQICCPEVGTVCTDDSDCCDEHICRSNGTCNECIADLQACTDSDDCCSGVCHNGECREDCTDEIGDPCPVQNKEGECAKGVVTCIDYVRNCEQVNDPETEICDDKDNDCDGQTDEGVTGLGSCSASPPPGCQVGFEAPGTEVCEEGMEVCVSTPGVNFCTIGSCDTTIAGSQSCGWCTTNPAECSVNSQCAPGAKCLYDAMVSHKRCQDDPMCNTTVDCWLPSMNGTCP